MLRGPRSSCGLCFTPVFSKSVALLSQLYQRSTIKRLWCSHLPAECVSTFVYVDGPIDDDSVDELRRINTRLA